MVKGKAEQKLIVVQHQPGIKRKRRLVFITGVIVIGAISFLLGDFQIRHRFDQVNNQLDALSAKFVELQEGEAILRQQVANLTSGREIDNLAKLDIQNTIKDFKSQVSQLEKDVSFYQNIMAPSDNARGLQVQKVDISAGSVSNRFNYKIVLAQVGDNKAYVNGVVAVNFIGMRGDKKEIIPLRNLSDQQVELGIKFKFKYFQDIEGDLVIPDGFIPESIQIVAQSKGKNASRLEQSFEWKQLLEQKS